VIDINLLPGAKKKRGGKGGGFQLPDLKSLVASVKNPWLIACVVGWVLFAGAIALFYLPRQAKLRALEPQLAAAQREARRLEAVLRTKAEAEAKRDSLLAQINVIRDIDRERYIWPHILDAVTQALPPYTWLDQLTVQAGASDTSTRGVAFQLSGKSADIQAVTRFVRNLEESPFLQNATAVSTAVVREEEHDVFTYVINVGYQEPDTTLLTLQPLAASLVQGYRSGAVRR
jgi:Tfp pilus assembly protein PilN